MSLIKLAILVTMMRRADRGELDLGQRLRVKSNDRRLGTGILSLLDPDLEVSLMDALKLMIIVSDNAATDLCLAAIGGPSAVAEEMTVLGMNEIEIMGDALTWFRALVCSINEAATEFSPSELFERGYPPLDPESYFAARERYHFGGGRPFSLASPRGLVALLKGVWTATIASEEGCGVMRKILKEQQMQTLLPRYSTGVTAEHKTGNFFPFIANDAGIFTAMNGNAAIMCVMAQRYRGHRERLEEVIARIGLLVFSYLNVQPPQK
jgi:beta-lactamase class A